MKRELKTKGVDFLSQTDTETIVHLFEELIKEGKSSTDAFKETVERLEGGLCNIID